MCNVVENRRLKWGCGCTTCIKIRKVKSRYPIKSAVYSRKTPYMYRLEDHVKGTPSPSNWIAEFITYTRKVKGILNLFMTLKK